MSAWQKFFLLQLFPTNIVNEILLFYEHKTFHFACIFREHWRRIVLLFSKYNNTTSHIKSKGLYLVFVDIDFNKHTFWKFLSHCLKRRNPVFYKTFPVIRLLFLLNSIFILPRFSEQSFCMVRTKLRKNQQQQVYGLQIRARSETRPENKEAFR